MKRYNNLYQEIISIENLTQAWEKARKGKSKQPGVIAFENDAETKLQELHLMLKNKEYKTSVYTTFKIYEPKERLIFRLPFYPDRIVHHAIMNVMEDIFVSSFTADTYSCIKGKGIHAAHNNIKRALRDEKGTEYCLKIDIKKFYPSIDHDILKELLRRKIKDKDLLWILDEIIDSTDGLPIGNYLSQYMANFYLSGFDHWIKQTKCCQYYFRYADDCVFLASDKASLHQLLADIKEYLSCKLKLLVKENYQIFKVEDRGIDVLGYKYFHHYILLRKRIKKSFARMLATRKNKASIASYLGWAKHANTINLLRKLGV